MQNFYLTFGVKYSSEIHPLWKNATSEGWVRIVAEDYETAREMAVNKFGMYWSFLYPEERFNTSDSRRYYPLGEILCIEEL